jgi:hypothetical protein
LNKDVKTIVKEVLLDAGLKSADFHFNAQESYPVRDFVVQYNESDLDFIQCMLSHYGLFYTFEQEDGGVPSGNNLWGKIRNQATNLIYTKGDFDQWKDLTKQRDDILNLMYGIVPYLAVTYDEKNIKENYKVKIVKANKVRVKVDVKRFELVSSRLDYRLRVYLYGFNSIYKNNKPYIELRPNDMDY